MVTTLLCDADGNLFGSEEPAFDASAGVLNGFLASLGVERRYTAHELRLNTTGKNFRTTATDLALEGRVSAERIAAMLEDWVEKEREAVTENLGTTLAPDPSVTDAVGSLAERYSLAVVSSSASSRLDVCFRAAGLDQLFPRDIRFSAEDSLAVPTSKPDPAIYTHAGEALGIEPSEAIAIEDAVPGVLSATAAGFQTVGNLHFVPPIERVARRGQLLEAGAAAVVETWLGLDDLLASPVVSGTELARS